MCLSHLHSVYCRATNCCTAGGATVFSKGFGLSSYELGAPMRADHRQVCFCLCMRHNNDHFQKQIHMCVCVCDDI